MHPHVHSLTLSLPHSITYASTSTPQLLFCPVQKSASTLWTQLVCRLTGDPHWYEPSWHKKLPTVRGKSREYIEEVSAYQSDHLPNRVTHSLTHSFVAQILNDPNWTKAIFLRDPTRR